MLTLFAFESVGKIQELAENKILTSPRLNFSICRASYTGACWWRISSHAYHTVAGRSMKLTEEANVNIHCSFMFIYVILSLAKCTTKLVFMHLGLHLQKIKKIKKNVKMKKVKYA